MMKTYPTIHRLLVSFSLLAVLLIISACGPAPQEPDTSDPGATPPSQPVETTPAPQDWPRYSNTTYGFSLAHPTDWTALEASPSQAFPIINLYPRADRTEADFPVDVHAPADVSYVAVFPEGFGTELPSGSVVDLNQASSVADALGDQWDRSRSQAFQLEDGSVWGLLLRPRQRPESWSQDGYLFAQFAVNDFSASCYAAASDRVKPMGDCDPMAGDRVVRSGQIDESARRHTLQALSSWRFGTEQGQTPIGDLIEITQPLPNSEIGSPVVIEGRARGYWFFEADFPVRLEDRNGNVLARGVANAAGEWMTEDFVPFSAELQYSRAPDDERGYLVFERANPSGMPENDRSFRLPVLFSPRSE